MAVRTNRSLPRSQPVSTGLASRDSVGSDTSARISGHSRGQTGAEVFIIVGIVLVLFIPFILGLYMQVNSFTDQINVNQADRVALELANAADSMYASGPGSNLSMNIQMPSGVESISITGREITFKMRVSSGTTDVVKLTKATVSGNLDSIKQPGSYAVSIYSERVSGNESRIVITPA